MLRFMSLSSLYLLIIPSTLQVAWSLRQKYFMMQDSWNISILSTWDVLGPFPIQAREQHYLSPSFPLDLSREIDYNQSWPSSYAHNGIVNWSSTSCNELGNIEISFPDIPWAYLRASNGWAALQHHAVLRTTLTVYPPRRADATTQRPALLVNLKQASYFALKPQTKDSQPYIPEWYPGNIYQLERALPYLLPLPDTISLIEPTSFDLFVSGDYEIRLFGDPKVEGSDIPVQRIQLEISLQDTSSNIFHLPLHDIIPQFVAGYPFGQPIGIALQNLGNPFTVVGAEALHDEIIRFSLVNDDTYTVASGQTRAIPMLLHTTSPCFKETLDLIIKLESNDTLVNFPVTVKLTHHKSWTAGVRQIITGTFLFGRSSPSFFVAMPPRLQSQDMHPPILALHGAGVDIIGHNFWPQSMPDNKFSWAIMAVGRTSWGLDWHGPSADDAWDAIHGLGEALKYYKQHCDCPWSYSPDLPVVLLGHSNGGQGTWYIASRYPDRVRAAVPAAGYIKSQAYVPLTLSRSSHFIDPILRAILESSLTPDDNDLHLSNLVDTAILAIHGSDDRNVPSWHSRELMATMHSWNFTNNNKNYHEDMGEDHWYPTILNNPHVQAFVDQYTSRGEIKAEVDDKFTLTTSAPHHRGSLRGWRIVELITPGRLGRLTVRRTFADASNGISHYDIETSNVRHFSTPPSVNRNVLLRVDDSVISVDARSNDNVTSLRLDDEGHWNWKMYETTTYKQPPGRVQAILSSPGPITIVTTSAVDTGEYSVALRVAYVLYLYHRIDSEIIDEEEAMSRNQQGTWSAGNMVVIGTSRSQFIQNMLASRNTPIGVTTEGTGFTVKSRPFKRDDQAIIFTHPHPTRSDSLVLCLLYHTRGGLECAARLFPYRTGIPLPDWAVLSSKMDDIGAGGILGAGVWGNDWSFSESMSWMY